MPLSSADLGQGAVLAALVAAACAVTAGFLGGRTGDYRLVLAARNGAFAVAGMLTLAAISLLLAFVNHDYSVQYVADHSSRSMPPQLVIAAFYSGQEGSLLFWALGLSILAAVAIWREQHRLHHLLGYAIGVLMSVEAFFLFILGFVSGPFNRLPGALPDGQGLNPLLYDGGMLIHPPFLLLGYASVAVPYAFAMSALLAGHTDADWMRATRRYSLLAWSFLTAGNLLGAWWAYHVLGWGGYWGWDPVENSAIMPWLAITAYIHGVMVQQRRGMLKVWNMSLVIAAFALAVQGTFVVRSGVITSVHSFAQSAIGPYFFGFLAIVVIFSVAVLLHRLPHLKDEDRFESLASRETGFLLNNVLLTSVAFATYWGTVFPILSEAIRGIKATVGPPFYQQVNGPLLLLLLILMGIGPLLPWRRATGRQIQRSFVIPMAIAGVAATLLVIIGLRTPAAILALVAAAFAAATVGWEYWRGGRARMRSTAEAAPIALARLIARARPRYGGYLVHLGVAVMAVGIVNSSFYQQAREFTLPLGTTGSVGRYSLTNQGLFETREPGAHVVSARVRVTDSEDRAWTLSPGKVFHDNFTNQPASRIAIETTRLEDLYLVLAGWGDDGSISIVATVNPMVVLIWAGGWILLIGTLVCLWPEPTHVVPTVTVPMPRAAPAATVEV
ncbi:MAG: heme lyase CcmF/NrfE family subunit [Chloroflexi bacterium]|nr:heme lyase CcmF/NrfE family subunit [Chloroflexota bacterium]